MAGTESKLKQSYRRLQAFREQHHHAQIAAFFVGGVLFDIVTLTRIDDAITYIQLGLYQAALVCLLVLEERYRAGVAAPPRLLLKAWRYSEEVIHFLFGTLLSIFILFYLKSTSGLSSILFMAFLYMLLVANELPRFRERGPLVRFALLSLCMTTYCALLLPVLLGFLSKWLFLAAVALSCAAIGGLARGLTRWTGNAKSIREQVVAPALAMQVLLVAAYFAGAIPPVPLSVQFVGIYHEVVPPGREPATTPGLEAGPVQASFAPGRPPAIRTYQLKHQRPWWKVWQHGDQDFAARPGDTVYCFARIFAPNGFHDAIYVHWLLKGQKGGWTEQGRTPLSISGGRGEGFRAYATKKNYQPGRWRVEIETEDGRDIGVIKFDLFDDPSSEERTFTVDRL
jgi:hypothetical protein